jgi:hypothetical protein
MDRYAITINRQFEQVGVTNMFRDTTGVEYIVQQASDKILRVVKLLETHPARCGYVQVRTCTTAGSSLVLLPVTTGTLTGVKFTESEIERIINVVRDQVQCINRLYDNRQLAYRAITTDDVRYRRTKTRGLRIMLSDIGSMYDHMASPAPVAAAVQQRLQLSLCQSTLLRTLRFQLLNPDKPRVELLTQRNVKWTQETFDRYVFAHDSDLMPHILADNTLVFLSVTDQEPYGEVFTKANTLGQGTYGKVVRYHNATNTIAYAVKQLTRPNDDELVAVRLLEAHPDRCHLIQARVCVTGQGQQQCVLMPLMDGDAFENAGNFNAAQIKQLIDFVLDQVTCIGKMKTGGYYDSAQLMYMDIKLENVLWRLNADTTMTFTLGDLGSIIPYNGNYIKTTWCSNKMTDRECQKASIGVMMYDLIMANVRNYSPGPIVDALQARDKLREHYGPDYMNLIPIGCNGCIQRWKPVKRKA